MFCLHLVQIPLVLPDYHLFWGFKCKPENKHPISKTKDEITCNDTTFFGGGGGEGGWEEINKFNVGNYFILKHKCMQNIFIQQSSMDTSTSYPIATYC